ncbi:hypothetical protein HN588_08315 [Candidatus Bathyarchaeota archaeon]|jgi:predicted DNA-binding protein|nr:hypothetical protein [Candidatus Bathyarchaeota archaeon]
MSDKPSVHATTIMSVRVTHKVRDKFHKLSQKYGKPSDVLKELVEGFVEGRVSIQKPEKPMEKLYNES